MSFCNFLENRVLDHLFLKGDYIASYMYLGLWIGDPTDSGEAGDEVSGGSYSRQVMTGIYWERAYGVMLNDLAITFPEATAYWGDVTHFVLFNALTGGNMLMYGALVGAPINIVAGSVPRFAAGRIAVEID